MSRLPEFTPADPVRWTRNAIRVLEVALFGVERTKQQRGEIFRLRTLAKTALPTATNFPNSMLICSNGSATGGAEIVYTTATGWVRASDRAAVP